MLNHVQGQVWKRVWIFEARSENGSGKWHFLVWNWSGFGDAGGTTPPKIPRTTPPGPISGWRLVSTAGNRLGQCTLNGMYVCMYLFVYAGYLYIWQLMKLMWTCGQLTTHNERRPDHNTGNSAPSVQRGRGSTSFSEHKKVLSRFLRERGTVELLLKGQSDHGIHLSNENTNRCTHLRPAPTANARFYSYDTSSNQRLWECVRLRDFNIYTLDNFTCWLSTSVYC